MEMFLIGLRNVSRNPRRSALNIAALAIGVAVMIFGLGWIRGYSTMIYDGVRTLETGDLQVLPDGYLEEERRMPLDIALGDAASVARRIAEVGGIAAVAPRIDFSATVGAEAGSVRVLARAIDPAAEARVTSIRDFISAGAYLSPNAGGVLLGAPLASKLGVKVGQLIAFSALDRYSVQNFIEVPVRGIFRFGLPSMDENLVFVDIATARELLGMPEAATRLVVRLEGRTVEAAVSALKERLAGIGVSVYPWRRFAPVIVSATSADIGGFWIVFLIIFLLIITGIVNSMSMSVQERTREIGTLRAIGIRRSQLTLLFLSEAVTLALAAAVAGCLLGGALAWYVQAVGFDFSSTSLEVPIPLGRRFTGDYRVWDFLIAVGASVAAALAGSFLPVRRAAGLNISRSLGVRVE